MTVAGCAVLIVTSRWFINCQINNLLDWTWHPWNSRGNGEAIGRWAGDTRGCNCKNSCCWVYRHERRNYCTVVAAQTEGYWGWSWERTRQIWYLRAGGWFSSRKCLCVCLKVCIWSCWRNLIIQQFIFFILNRIIYW